MRELFARATVAWRARVNSEGERLQNVAKYTEHRGVGIKQIRRRVRNERTESKSTLRDSQSDGFLAGDVEIS